MVIALLFQLVIPLGLDLYLPSPERNPITIEKIELGRRLFNDRRLSRDGTLACASCHNPARAFSSDQRVTIGIDGRAGRRNAPALINRGYGRAFFWDGRDHSLEDVVVKPIQNPDEMDLPVAEAARRVGLTSDDLSKALATFVRSILSGDSRFDRFVSGQREALTMDEQRGLQVFRNKGHCASCHAGPTLTDELLHNTGIAWRDEQLHDAGGGNGRFKTPTLREIARTSPYMHDGSLATLEEVVDFYDRGGRNNPFLDKEMRPLNLTAEEKRALVALLRALSSSQ